MPRGASPRREREYRKLERQFEREHRYPGREEEVAARIVNKQRQQSGETKKARQNDVHRASRDSHLPLQDYQKLTIRQIEGRMEDLSTAEIRKIRTYETHHKNRKRLLTKIDRRLAAH